METKCKLMVLFRQVAEYADFIVAEETESNDYYVFLKGQWNRNRCASYLHRDSQVIGCIEFMNDFYK